MTVCKRIYSYLLFSSVKWKVYNYILSLLKFNTRHFIKFFWIIILFHNLFTTPWCRLLIWSYFYKSLFSIYCHPFLYLLLLTVIYTAITLAMRVLSTCHLKLLYNKVRRKLPALLKTFTLSGNLIPYIWKINLNLTRQRYTRLLQ